MHMDRVAARATLISLGPRFLELGHSRLKSFRACAISVAVTMKIVAF
jgi:hypothetical protein